MDKQEQERKLEKEQERLEHQAITDKLIVDIIIEYFNDHNNLSSLEFDSICVAAEEVANQPAN